LEGSQRRFKFKIKIKDGPAVRFRVEPAVKFKNVGPVVKFKTIRCEPEELEEFEDKKQDE